MNTSSAMLSQSADASGLGKVVRAGLLGGLVGGVVIWIYEAIVWVGAQHLMPLAGIPRNATGLVFGMDVQNGLGALAYVVGTVIQFSFALAWGVGFALVWPAFARRSYEVTLIAPFLCRLSLDRDACRDRGRFLQPSELSRSERDHRRLHVAFLLRRAAGPDRQASTRKGLIVRIACK